MSILVIACLAAGAITFQPQEMPGLHAGPVLPFTGLPSVNYRQADIDGNGLVDLVFDTALWTQQAGLFPPERRQPLPQAAVGALLDVDNGRIYCIREGRLIVLHWKDGALAVETNQKLDWPIDGNDSKAGLGRFLHDINGDHVPELVAVDEHTVTLFALRENLYVKAAQLAGVLPELRYLQLPQQPLWPKSRRALAFPARQMACDLVVDGAALSVIFRDPVPGGRFVFQYATRTLSAKDGEYCAEPAVVVPSAPVPEHVRPCRLNSDGIPDLAGCRREDSTGRSIPFSMVETWASLDGGKTFAVRRAAAMDRFLPQIPFVDVDGDGLTDLVTESTGLFEGGTREVVERFMTSTEIAHTVRVYLQKPGGFSETPAVEFQVEITLEAAPWRLPPMYDRYQSGTLVNVSGDFDGDGHRDIAVRDRADRVAVWLARGGAFSREPDTVVRIDAASEYAVADVNSDGRADIIETRDASPPPGKRGRMTVVHFALCGKGGMP
jgi:hypothetical protein